MVMTNAPQPFQRHTEPGDEAVFVRHSSIEAPAATAGAGAAQDDEKPAPKKAAKSE